MDIADVAMRLVLRKVRRWLMGRGLRVQERDRFFKKRTRAALEESKNSPTTKASTMKERKWRHSFVKCSTVGRRSETQEEADEDKTKD